VIANGTTINADQNTNTVSNITINTGGTLQSGNGATISLSGNFTNNGTFTANSGTVAFTGTAQTITGNTTFANLTVGAATVLTLAGNITVTGTLTGTINLASTCPTNYTVTLANGTVMNSCATAGAPPALLQYHMDETLWAGTTGEVVDSSGSGYNGTAVNGAATANSTPALAGNPGTCGYGVFNGNNNYVALPNTFPNLTTNFTITAWIRTTNNANSGQRILIDDQNNTGGYGFSLGDGGTGKLRFYARGSSQVILDTANVINSNTWYFVAAVADISNAKRYIYVYDATGAFVTSASVNSTGWGIDTGAASIGGENNSSAETGPAFHFAGNIDEVQVFNSALTQAALNTIAVQTHPCGGGGGGTGGCIPTTINGVQTPVMGGLGQVQTVAVAVNGTVVADTQTANSIAVTGVTTGVTPGLSPLVPATFPVSTSTATTSATTIAAGNYGTINTNAPTTFTGGNYYISTLNANNPITLGAGTYYINNLNLNANLTVTGVVQIFIGNNFQVNANNVSVNAGGSVANLQVNFYPNAQLDTQNSSNFSFT
jgi:MSHA biogenesis protein MshQ